MKGFVGKATCFAGFLVSASQVFRAEASPAIFILGLLVAFFGGLAIVEHMEEKA